MRCSLHSSIVLISKRPEEKRLHLYQFLTQNSHWISSCQHIPMFQGIQALINKIWVFFSVNYGNSMLSWYSIRDLLFPTQDSPNIRLLTESRSHSCIYHLRKIEIAGLRGHCKRIWKILTLSNIVTVTCSSSITLAELLLPQLCAFFYWGEKSQNSEFPNSRSCCTHCCLCVTRKEKLDMRPYETVSKWRGNNSAMRGEGT